MSPSPLRAALAALLPATLAATTASAVWAGGLDRAALAGGLAMGATAAVAAQGRPLLGLLGGGLGLLLAGNLAPLALSGMNWSLALVGLLLAGAMRPVPGRPRARWVATTLALLGVGMLLPQQGPAWGITLGAGLVGAQLPLPIPGWLSRALSWALGLATLGGALLTVNQGFVRVDNTAPRALLVRWGDQQRVLGPGTTAAWWTGGQALVFQARPGGPRFNRLPATESAPLSAQPTPVDLAEVGQRDCDALGPLAVGGDRRAGVQYLRGGCTPDLAPLAALDPWLDAARVLAGHPPQDAVALLSLDIQRPLDAPEAVALAAAVRLQAPRAAAQHLVDGTAYDRAALLAELSETDRQALIALVQQWSAEVPGPAGVSYRQALDALRGPGGS